MDMLPSKVKDTITKIGIAASCLYYGTAGVNCSDAFEVAENATETLTDKLYNLGIKIFPLAIIAMVISLFLTHDEKKIVMELKIGFLLVVLFVLMILAKNGVLTSTAQNLAGVGP